MISSEIEIKRRRYDAEVYRFLMSTCSGISPVGVSVVPTWTFSSETCAIFMTMTCEKNTTPSINVMNA